jgi:hypothetical protein
MNEGTGAAFAIRASDMDKLQPALRMIHSGEQTVHIVQTELDAEKLGGIEPSEFRCHRQKKVVWIGLGSRPTPKKAS